MHARIGWRIPLRAVISRALLLAAMWWALAEGDPRGWELGAAVIAGATLVSFALLPAGILRWHLGGLIRFLPFFAWHGILGGADVARRALHPALPLKPLLVRYPLRLPVDPAGVFFAHALSLTPGTLSAEIHEGELWVHVLDQDAPVRELLEAVEERVADLFGLNLFPDAPREPAVAGPR